MNNEQLIQQEADRRFYPKHKGNVHITLEMQEMINDFIEAATFGLSLQINEWVSVTPETMPEDPAIKAIGIPKYLILDVWGDVYEAYYDGDRFYKYNDVGNIEVLHATHWMPLPTQPNK